jgi:hypothetical protein
MRFQEDGNTFYFYTNNSNILSAKKQIRIHQLQRENSKLNIHNFNIINTTINIEATISAMGDAIP